MFFECISYFCWITAWIVIEFFDNVNSLWKFYGELYPCYDELYIMLYAEIGLCYIKIFWFGMGSIKIWFIQCRLVFASMWYNLHQNLNFPIHITCKYSSLSEYTYSTTRWRLENTICNIYVSYWDIFLIMLINIVPHSLSLIVLEH